jgi:predicted aspartyl protease
MSSLAPPRWRACSRCLAIAVATLIIAVAALDPTSAATRSKTASPPPSLLEGLPAGSIELPIENLEGVVLVRATLRGPSSRDTTGWLVVDTGAGFLGLDDELAHILGLTSTPAKAAGLVLATGALSRLELGALQIDQVSPVIVLDAGVIRRVTGRSVLGLAGQRVFRGHAVWIDYTGERLVCVPSVSDDPANDADELVSSDRATMDPAARARRVARIDRSRRLLAPLLTAQARPISFRLGGDHKILVRARFREAPTGRPSEWMTLVFDTGATKSVLFEPALGSRYPASRRWRSVSGLVAPTLVGTPTARLTLAPVFEIETAIAQRPVRVTNIDCAAIETDLAKALSDAIGEPVAGLIGYSAFKRSRVAIDYPNRVLWLDPDLDARDEHPFEYSHVGLQLERDGEHVRVLAVAVHSPADSAGISAGDILVAVGQNPARVDDLVRLTDLLEGPPGSRVQLTLRRDGIERTYRLTRRRLL